MENSIAKHKIHPNSLANLTSHGRNKEPVKNLARKIRGFDDDQTTPIFKIIFQFLNDETETTKDRLHAAEILLNRGWGRAIETIVIEDESGILKELRQYNLEDLKNMRDNVITIEGKVRIIEEGE